MPSESARPTPRDAGARSCPTGEQLLIAVLAAVPFPPYPWPGGTGSARRT
ncbi:hypothetical protein [Streptomyces sp. NPDC006193]